MSTRLVNAASRTLASHTSRRGFLRRLAVAGSALVTNPASYVLRPLNAYQVVVRSADCRSGKCAQGWTEFCCTLTGVNTCPPGSVVAGWWRAEGSGYCNGTSRYYMDCHAASCGSCGCGSSGTCDNSCVYCDCHCAHNRCDLWKTCCIRFRYGQCNQQLACVGPIICRVVTCVPPWQWDTTCTTTDAREDATRFHDAPCLNPPAVPYFARPGIVTGSKWELRSNLSAGPAEQAFDLGVEGDVPLMADWTGAGVATAAVVRGVRHGVSGDQALTWYIRQVEGAGQPELAFDYGSPGDLPVAGDWNGDRVHTVGVFRGGQWLLRNSNSTGNPDLVATFGQPGDIPVVGDWNGDGIDGIGVVRGTTWMLRNTASSGPAEITFDFGDPAGAPVVGDWNGNGVDTPGRYTAGLWELSDSFSGGAPVVSFSFGGAGSRPVVWRRLPEPGAG